MHHRSPPALAVLLLTISVTFGCAGEKGGDGLHVVTPGKADNYYSNVAAEYELTGSVTVAMTEQEYADPAARDMRVSERLTAVGLYLTTYLTDKFRGIDINGDGEITEDEVFFHNEDYGGFHAMVRNYSLETGEIEAVDPGSYLATFTVDVAGPPGMLSVIPGEWIPDTGSLRFTMQMPAGMTVTPDSVPRSEIRNFDPADYAGELEEITFDARAHAAIGDAWPHYAAFMADGVYDITMFYGHDYNADRWDLQGAREAFNSLQYSGFDMPVDSFEELSHDSGPATRTMPAGGKDITVAVRIYHSDMFEGARALQHDTALAEIASRDVFFYNGHAGPYYGFYLDADGAAKVDYHEFADYPFDADKQQLVIAQGCQTYSQYADMLYANPAKDESNLDVITTVNYSYGQGTVGILNNLLSRYAGASGFDTPDAGDSAEHRPVSFYEIIRDLNSDWINSSYDVFYGVMGIDGNEMMHPYADPTAIGRSCSSVDDCGNIQGHVCVDPGSGQPECAAVSLGESGCPEGTRYLQLASGQTITSGACFSL